MPIAPDVRELIISIHLDSIIIFIKYILEYCILPLIFVLYPIASFLYNYNLFFFYKYNILVYDQNAL